MRRPRRECHPLYRHGVGPQLRSSRRYSRGTGKTKSLQVLAENLSDKGIPVLLMDIKGDLSGLAQPSPGHAKIDERHAKIGIPYMGVGRNLAYTKTTFFNANGFVNHIHRIKSGDDDLFINQVATKQNTAYCISKDSFTESIAPNTFSEWFQQKRRHISTANHYKFTHRFFLGLFFLSKVLFYLLAIVLSFFYPIKVLLPLIVCYFVVQFIVIHRSSKKLNEPMISYVFPFLEIILLLFHFSIFITNLSSKPTHWK